MKTLRYLLVGGVLTLGAAMAKETPKPATSATPASQTKPKKQNKLKKAAKTVVAPVTSLAHRK
jgi:hypothetical protein